MDLRLSVDQQRHVEEFGAHHGVTEISMVVVGVNIEKDGAEVRDLFETFGEALEIRAGAVTFLFIFRWPRDAALFGLRLQRRLRKPREEEGHPPHLRIGMHMCELSGGEAGEPPGHVGSVEAAVTTANRVMELAQHGQTLMTRLIFDRARAETPRQACADLGAVTWLSHGPYRVRGIAEPLMLFEVGEETTGPFAAPADSEAAHHFLSPGMQPVPGWRPALGLTVPGSKWVLEEKLGEGTFGESWRGRHPDREEAHVFKFCFRAERVHALRHDDTLLRAITDHVSGHPRTVGVHAFRFDGPPYHIEMDHVPGVNLASWCAERGGVARVPLETRLEIVCQVAEALEGGHREGVLHLNLKPANILVSGTGETAADVDVTLTDFGVGQISARGVLGEATRESVRDAMSVAESTARAETRLHMAPEIRAGLPVTSRSDIYSLGVLLDQLLRGDLRRPLPADWPMSTEDWLIRLVLARCVSVDPEERFVNAGEIATRIRDLPRQRALIRRGISTAAVILGVVLLAGGGWLLRPKHHLTLQLPGGSTLEMVRVPGGTFEMGAPETEAGRDSDEGPSHVVSISGFHAGIHEVTVSQYRSFLVATGHPEPEYWGDQLQHPTLPVTWMDWQDAAAFCRWLTWSQEGTFSLPSEAQWEYACRAGTISPFVTGTTLEPDQANIDFGDEQLVGLTPPVRRVGGGVANGFGLFDMHGNVREWCWDWYDPDFYAAEASSDPDPINEIAAEKRVVRGGSWATLAEGSRSASRDAALPESRDPTLGFRVIRTEE
jgi:formylglycine-generating enzyme required for sulfatase activity/class 3 adenylate cyclase